MTSNLNCLQCGHCSLHKSTNVQSKGTIINCAVAGPKPINLQGCPVAVPTQTEGRGVAWNEVALKFLQVYYPTAEQKTLCKVLGRTWRAIQKKAEASGYTGTRCIHTGRKHGQALKGRKRTWTPLQDAYLRVAYISPDWPFRDKEAQQKIVEEVARLGPPHDWKPIQRHAHYLTPQGQKDAEALLAYQRAWYRRKKLTRAKA